MIPFIVTSNNPRTIPKSGAFGSTGSLYSFAFGGDETTYLCIVSSGYAVASYAEYWSGGFFGSSTVSTAKQWSIFKQLVRKWRKERGITSSAVNMAMSPSYQKIIGMGPAAVPFILQELRKRSNDPEHWFWALEMITGEDPIPLSSYGNTVEMARAWLSWAENQNGLAAGGQVSFHH
jgi:hypothetical protein